MCAKYYIILQGVIFLDPSVAIRIVVLMFLLFLSAFFSCSETALTTVNRIRIRTLIEEGNKKAVTLGKVIENPGKMLGAILIGNNIVNISSSSLATVLAIEILGDTGAGVATGIITLLVLIFGEITPKTLATLNAEKIALFVAGIIYSLMWILTPAIYIVNKLSHVVLRLMRVNPDNKATAITETELRTIVEVGHEEGILETEEHQMINNVFEFGDSRARDIMVPRIDMIFVSVDSTYQELLDIYEEYHYTRLPVYEESSDNVIGIINIKDLLLYKPEQEFSVKNYLRDAYFTYESKRLSELLLEMKKTSVNIAIVLDEYGVTAGLITLEDLLEEIVGEIRDEYDEDEEEIFKTIAENEYLVDGQIKLGDLNDLLESELSSEDYDSLGGYIMEHLDRLPEENDDLTSEGFRFVVEALDKNRIKKVRIYRLPAEDTSEE
ncbi:MAG: HlyC/CorC family transporter [Lachnospiraceae bacterium]|nr:HlyC/CorC family transporter [Lachnospiraceae bacterium]